MIWISIYIKTEISFKPDDSLLLKLLKIKDNDSMIKEALTILNKVKDLVKPKLIIKKVEINEIGKGYILINNISLNSRILAKKAEGSRSNTAYLFIAVGGNEIDELTMSVTDYYESYVLDQIAYMSCVRALEAVKSALVKEFNVKKYITLLPGSLPDWDASELLKITDIIGDDYSKIGVGITEMGMLKPAKSVCGLAIESEDSFSSCEICTKENCPNREAELDMMKHKELVLEE